MYKSRFNDLPPHHADTQLLERCQECIRDYDLYYKGWTEPKNHTISYLAAAYLELAKQYEALINDRYIEDLSSRLSAGDLAEEAATKAFEQSVFEAQMNSLQDDNVSHE